MPQQRKNIKPTIGNTNMPSHKALKTRADSSPSNYSNDVKKKLAASNRTGQACDRCRIRKMRCDEHAEGCSPCQQNHSECKTTDRITGIATVRGYVQNLERRVRELQEQNNEYEERLMAMGVDVRPTMDYSDATTASLLRWNETQGDRNRQVWGNHGNGLVPPANNASQHTGNEAGPTNEPLPDTNSCRLPNFRGGLAGNNYLGVSSGNSLLSSIRGTALSVLGMEIDIADYVSPDLDEPDPSVLLTRPLHNKSYHAFVQTAFSTGPKLEKVELPPKDEGLTYAQWFFRVINPYLPILHKPTFMTLLTTIYDNQGAHIFQPSTAETVMVHMMFAIMFFQYAARNWENSSQQSELNDLSNRHYHYALGFFPQLISSHTFQDVQALTLICLHLRSFPKPGACWMMTTMTINLAIELGLHRSERQWASSTPRRSVLESEMRKRIFWSILVIHVLISGKLGRPMALRPDDFDVELPRVVDDDLLGENGVDASRPGKCGFLVGMEAFKVELIFMDLYNNIYAVKRSPKTYIETVRRLDNRIRQWCDQWPVELLPETASNDEEGRVHAQYMSVWLFEFLLLLRHPSLSLTSSAEFNSENLSVCMDASQRMLHHVKQIQRYRSLDTNWQNAALYVLAISTSLYGHWERRDDITRAIHDTLKDDMNAWLSILGDVGALLGSGNRLQEAVRGTVDNTLGLLSRHLAHKTATSALSAPPGGRSSPLGGSSSPLSHHLQAVQSPPQVYHPAPWAPQMPVSTSNTTNPADLSNQHAPNFLSPEIIAPPPASFPGSTHFTYPEPFPATYPTSHSSAPYPPNPTIAPYHPHPPSFPPSQYPHPTQQATTTAANPFVYPNQHSYHTYAGAGSSSSWRLWACNITATQEPQEYINSASALMQLGGRGETQSTAGTGVTAAEGIGEGDAAAGLAGQPWPLMLFDPAQGSG